MAWIALLLCAGVPHGPRVLVDRVDVIELNHLQCPTTGRVTLVQVIYWRWCEADCQHHVVAWRMDRPARLRREGREWIETWTDAGVSREVRAPYWRETWTFEDPELVDRESFSKDARRGLRKHREP